MKLFDLIPRKHWDKHCEAAFREKMAYEQSMKRLVEKEGWSPPRPDRVRVHLHGDPDLSLPEGCLDFVACTVYQAAARTGRLKPPRCSAEDLDNASYTCFLMRIPLKQVLFAVRNYDLSYLWDLAIVAAYHRGIERAGLPDFICDTLENELSQEPEAIDFTVDGLVRTLAPASDDRVRQLFLVGGGRS